MKNKIFFLLAFCGLIFWENNKISRAQTTEFGFDDVVKKAEAESKKTYDDKNFQLPDVLKNMNYEQHSDIRFLRENGPWYGKDLLFEMQLHHQGGLFNKKVQINEIVEGKAVAIPYNYKFFDFGKNQIHPEVLDKNIGYAGFRIHYPLNRSDYYDELVSFLGSSYFRSMGRGQRYGLSARGIALNTGESSMVEEFPYFKEFWIKRPKEDQREIMIYALMDSESITGAYQFEIFPGNKTVMNVKSVLFPRKDIYKLGVAPLTSMFLYGENTRFRFDDYRPEVHDSDGLLVWNGNDEKIWRPLDNSKHLRLSSFEDENPQGFGLMQRDRNPRNYLDPEAMYELRPSLWIKPEGNWGKGKVQLAELPSVNETNDNVVAYWVPAQPIKAGQKYAFDYQLSWGEDAGVRPELAKVTSTHSGLGGDGLAGEYIQDQRKFVIDFSEFDNADLKKNIENGNIWADISNMAGKISNIRLMYTPSINGATLYFDFAPNQEIIELRVVLRDKSQNNKVISEVWSYQWWK